MNDRDNAALADLQEIVDDLIVDQGKRAKLKQALQEKLAPEHGQFSAPPMREEEEEIDDPFDNMPV